MLRLASVSNGSSGGAISAMDDRQRPTKQQPFASYDLAAAYRYDAWYDSPAGRALALVEETLLLELLAGLPAATSLLDVGCGTGHFSRRFARGVSRVVGLDPAPGMLAIARERAGGPTYVRGSALALPFADRAFDVVAFVTSLEFVPDRVGALREAARVARHGLILGVLNLLSPLGLRRKAQTLLGPSPYAHAYFPTPWGLAGLARRALGPRALELAWQTTPLAPGWPAVQVRLPLGAMIGLRVTLGEPSRGD
jgi:ubiquinone/menaquinone biosynthesis C-methylase UbiE